MKATSKRRIIEGNEGETRAYMYVLRVYVRSNPENGELEKYSQFHRISIDYYKEGQL